jgi:two-component system alkaline phosphatase synthesis response regulator PhoP/two-component system response regulator VicR
MAKILVVDDEKHIVRLVEINLQRAGYEVVTAYDGVEGLEKVRAEKPDLVILDIMMPKMDGWEVLRNLSQDPATADLQVVVLSAKAQDADIAKTLSTGQAIHLTKPFNPRELLVMVERILAFANDDYLDEDREPVYEV